MGLSTFHRYVQPGFLPWLAAYACLISWPQFGTAQDAEAGKRLYREGILADNSKLTATVEGDLQLSGKFVACAKCHRRSGRGAQEGARLVPAIHAQSLFREKRADRARLFRNLYQEEHSPETDAKVSSQPTRPAYDHDSLVRVLHHGVDANGRDLQPLMPKYTLSETDLGNLIAYLRQLGDKPSPGVNNDEIHFATVIAGNVPTSESRAMLDVLHTYADCHNLEVDRYRARPDTSLNYKSEFTKTLRKWRIHVWELKGESRTWNGQLEKHYQSTPVFAILSGRAGGAWQPIHAFCEQHEIPCVFPTTNVPDCESGNDFTLYYHRGMIGEAKLAATAIKKQLNGRGSRFRILQLHDNSAASLAGKQELHRLLKNQSGIEIKDLSIGEIPVQPEAETATKDLPVEAATQVIAWLSSKDIEALGQTSYLENEQSQVYVSGMLCDGPAIKIAATPHLKYITSPVSEKLNTSPDLFRVRRWLSSRRIYDIKNEPLQLNTYFACLLTKHSLRHLVADFDRDYFIEWAEHECESVLNPGVYKKLSLGPGQRFATRLRANEMP